MISPQKMHHKCILCKTKLDSLNTKVVENPKYLKYRNLVCNACFDEYYPLDQGRNKDSWLLNGITYGAK